MCMMNCPHENWRGECKRRFDQSHLPCPHEEEEEDMVPEYAVLTPAYGRDYNNAHAAKLDFMMDYDFVLRDPTSKWDGKPANRTSLQKVGYKKVQIYYKNKTRCIVADITESLG